MSTGARLLAGPARQPRPGAGRGGEPAPAGGRTKAPGEALDRVMFWVVGALLVALNAALVVLQSHPLW